MLRGLKTTPQSVRKQTNKQTKNKKTKKKKNIVTREDDYKTKTDEVNKILEEICGQKGIPLIRNNSITSNRHWNRSRLD